MTKKREALTTIKQVKALKPEASGYNHNIAGSRGLYIKVLPSGRKGWFYRYRVGTLFEWMKIGDYTEGSSGMSLAEARDEITKQRQIDKNLGRKRPSFRTNPAALT